MRSQTRAEELTAVMERGRWYSSRELSEMLQWPPGVSVGQALEHAFVQGLVERSPIQHFPGDHTISRRYIRR